MEIVNIGIAGLGTVGSEVAKQLQLNSEFLNKKAGKKLNLVAAINFSKASSFRRRAARELQATSFKQQAP